MEDIVVLSTKASFNMVKELLDSKPSYISHKEASRKYKGLLDAWVSAGLIKAIPTSNAKHCVYPAHRLIELYEIYITGGRY